MSLNDFLTWLKELVEEFAPALAVIFWNYEETKIDEEKNKTLDAQTNLELEKNHENVDAKYSGKSDLDVLNDAIVSGGGQPGQSDGSSEPTTPSAADSTGQKK